MRFPVSKPTLGEAERNAVARVMESGWLTQGQEVQRFERELGSLLGSPHVVACSSGTAALHLALRVAGIGPGDEVLVPDLTYVATVNAVLYVGARPVLVDVRRADWNLDLEDAGRRVTTRTRAVLAVHLYGMPCDRVALTKFCQQHQLLLIEDACETLAAKFDDGSACGTLGTLGVLSFYANKMITTGEGGAVLTADPQMRERLELLRGQGQDRFRRFWHTDLGYNYRMMDLQAAIGCAQLEQYDELRSQRQAVCDVYRIDLEDLLGTQKPNPFTVPSPWLFTGTLPSVQGRQSLMSALAACEIETRPVFSPLHRLPHVRPFVWDELTDSCFPVASFVSDRGISLPTHAEMTIEDAQDIAREFRGALAEVA